jgi:hypothetical protein
MRIPTASGRNTRTDRSPRRTTATAAVAAASRPDTNRGMTNDTSQTPRCPEATKAEIVKKSAANAIRSRTAQNPSLVLGVRWTPVRRWPVDVPCMGSLSRWNSRGSRMGLVGEEKAPAGTLTALAATMLPLSGFAAIRAARVAAAQNASTSAIGSPAFGSTRLRRRRCHPRASGCYSPVGQLQGAPQRTGSRRSVHGLELGVPLLRGHNEPALLVRTLRRVVSDENADVCHSRAAVATAL